MTIKRYDYSPFNGINGLRDFIFERKECINNLNILSNDLFKDEYDIFLKYNIPTRSEICFRNIDLSGEINLRDDLIGFLNNFFIKREINKKFILRLIHKIEVQRCIYERYSGNFIKGYGITNSFTDYVLVSFSLLMYFKVSSSLQALSLSLKINDWIMVNIKLWDFKELPLKLIKNVIASELEIIGELMEKNNIYA